MSDQPIFFNFGDLVRTDGYWPRVFRVDGYHIDTWRYPNETWTETVYELVDAYTGEFLEADVEDLTLVETADKAEEYLAANPAPKQAGDIFDWNKIAKEAYSIGMGAETMAKQEPRKPSARELSAQLAKESKELRKKRSAEIDNLLDMRNWASEMLAKTGNEEFGDRVFAIDCELKKLTEND